MRTTMVVVLHPQSKALTGLFEAPELGSVEEFAEHRLPETLDLAQRHRMMGRRFDVFDPVLLQLLLKLCRTAPVGVLPAIVRQHLLGDAVLANPTAIHLKHIRGRLAPEHLKAGNVPGVVIDEADDIRLTTAEAEGKDIRLPQLIRCGTLEETRPGHVPLRFLLRRRIHQSFLVKPVADRLRAGRKTEPTLKHIRDALDTEARVSLLGFDDLFGDCLGKALLSILARLRFKPILTCKPVQAYPLGNGIMAGAKFHADRVQ
jgi:hypothetical protein